MTPLHLAAYSGNENVVRLLLNSAGVQVFFYNFLSPFYPNFFNPQK